MINIIFDTDIGGDIDDTVALALLARAHAEKAVRHILTTSCNSHPASLALIQSVNQYYGQPEVPCALFKGVPVVICDYNWTASETAKRMNVPIPEFRDAADAVETILRTLERAEDQSVRFVATGTATTLAAVLRCPGAKDLIARKVVFLSIMCCDFDGIAKNGECNVIVDLPAMQLLMREWPTPMVIAPYSLGRATPVAWDCLRTRLAADNPVRYAYQLYYRDEPEPGDRPSWDPCAMLFALEPDADIFGISEPGTVEILPTGISVFHPDPTGKHRILRIDADHSAASIRAALHARYRDRIE